MRQSNGQRVQLPVRQLTVPRTDGWRLRACACLLGENLVDAALNRYWNLLILLPQLFVVRRCKHINTSHDSVLRGRSQLLHRIVKLAEHLFLLATALLSSG